MCGGQRPPLATRSRKPWPEGGPDPARPRTETDPLRPQGPCFSSSQLQTPEWWRNRATSSPDTESNVLKVRAHLQTRLDSERRRKSRGKRNRGRAAEETRPVRPSARPPSSIIPSSIHPSVHHGGAPPGTQAPRNSFLNTPSIRRLVLSAAFVLRTAG